jgi:hypothetical protein
MRRWIGTAVLLVIVFGISGCTFIFDGGSKTDIRYVAQTDVGGMTVKYNDENGTLQTVNVPTSTFTRDFSVRGDLVAFLRAEATFTANLVSVWIYVDGVERASTTDGSSTPKAEVTVFVD